jgi:hypothetical protein
MTERSEAIIRLSADARADRRHGRIEPSEVRP